MLFILVEGTVMGTNGFGIIGSFWLDNSDESEAWAKMWLAVSRLQNLASYNGISK
jgi:hypothetical protein